jgi:outer membrane biosynthesis protein TonB
MRFKGMKRPLSFVIAAVAGVLLIAAVGASAHTGLSLSKFVGTQQGHFNSEASGGRTESPEPTDSPEASPSPEPTEKPEPSPTAEPTEAPEPTDPPEDAKPSPSGSGEGSGSGGHDGGHGD